MGDVGVEAERALLGFMATTLAHLPAPLELIERDRRESFHGESQLMAAVRRLQPGHLLILRPLSEEDWGDSVAISFEPGAPDPGALRITLNFRTAPVAVIWWLDLRSGETRGPEQVGRRLVSKTTQRAEGHEPGST